MYLKLQILKKIFKQNLKRYFNNLTIKENYIY